MNSMESGRDWSETEDHQPTSAPNASTQQHDPNEIGRYRVLRRLGQGGFGRVYMAHDDDLDRSVAIKVPNPERVTQANDLELYLTEARVLAKFTHPNIVPVYDVGRTDDGVCFVVSKYIDGSDLSQRIKEKPPTLREAVELTAVVSQALHHAHTRGLVHRDIKPANILIDASGIPWVADFGLALKDEDYGRGARQAGTLLYMSPEQARSEGHRVDGRSDIFSLGVVLYELLAGRKPFRGDSRLEVMNQITSSEPRPLRQIDDTIPRELERICQKALAKRLSERYDTARDMAEDLLHFLEAEGSLASTSAATSPVKQAQPPSTQELTPISSPSVPSDSDSRAIRIVPKGLRSFDRHDADFFVQLLPGPRDRDGLPDSLRFWKARIESIDTDSTFRVGLIYGPSGCGKSSLVKAGLLPHLRNHVFSFHIEATPNETEARILRGLRRICPDLKQEMDLVESLAAIRRGHVLRQGQKVLLVIDQFEQWLFTRRGETEAELVAALRQCDGVHLQAIVMVRDDFWMAATRFMRDLENRLVEGTNSAAVDLFDLLHAKKVLTSFGHAYGVLPEKSSEQTADQRAFLEQAIAGLSQENKVVSVRLALFAEMVKGKPWTPATLKEVGGAQGVGVAFLEETFSLSTAPPEHRLHQKAAQAVLKALLPHTGTDIKGRMRSESELREVSGYANRPRDFADLIEILDGQLRLITPTDVEGSTNENTPTANQGERYYQLTHDYLVNSLRDWLSRKQRETKRGRAEVRLAERAAIWESRAESRHLPSLVEWVTIRGFTRSDDWTEPQKRMMKRAGRVHGARIFGFAAAGVIMCGIGVSVFHRLAEADKSKSQTAERLVQELLRDEISSVPGTVESLRDYRQWSDPLLRDVINAGWSQPKAKLHASLALLPVDSSQSAYLEKRLADATIAEVLVLRDALLPRKDELANTLWKLLESTKPLDPTVIASAGALARFDPESSHWNDLSSKVSDALVTVDEDSLPAARDVFRPVRSQLKTALWSRFSDRKRPETEHAVAREFIADYYRDDPKLFADLLTRVDPKSHSELLHLVEKDLQAIVPHLELELSSKPAAPLDAAGEEERANRQARAAATLMRVGKPETVWKLFEHSKDPEVRSFLIFWLRQFKVDPKLLLAELGALVGDRPSNKVSDLLFDPIISKKRAFILSLGTYEAAEIPASDFKPLVARLEDLYRNDPDPGVHSAVEWTMRGWRQGDAISAIDVELGQMKDRGRRCWFVNGQGQTFVVINGPLDFVIGSPDTEAGRNEKLEKQHRVRIPRSFAIATKEVTVEQFRKFLADVPKPKFDVPTETDLKHSTIVPNGPWLGTNWYLAAHYCNWLSKREGLPEDQWCYVPGKESSFDEGMSIPQNVSDRKGYRLLTEAEWEYACRAGTNSPRYFGASMITLGEFARTLETSGAHAGVVGTLLPNDLGLFDMLGNAYEWCHDRGDTIRPENNGIHVDVMLSDVISDKKVRLMRGGFFNEGAIAGRSANRAGASPSEVNMAYGLRIGKTVD